MLPNVHPHVPSVVSGDPADKAGIKPGDVIVSIDGTPITFSYQLRDTIAKHPDQAISMSILRDGAPPRCR